LIEAGALKNPDVEAVLGLHVLPSYPVGTIALKAGELMAIADDFELTINGRGSHGALPDLAVDPIMVTAQVIQGLQHIISRKINPAEPALLSFGTIHGGTTQNIIPDEVILTGTVRCTSPTVKEEIFKAMHQTLGGITKAWGADYQLNYLNGYPPVVNDPEMADMIMDVVREDPDLTLEVMTKPLMIGEDFSYYGMHVPSGYFFLGCGSAEKRYPLHHSSFDIEETCLPLGVKVMTQCIYKFFNK
jgi:amidohydrolase